MVSVGRESRGPASEPVQFVSNPLQALASFCRQTLLQFGKAEFGLAVVAVEGAAASRGIGVGVVWAIGPVDGGKDCLLYTSPSPRDGLLSRMPSSA